MDQVTPAGVGGSGNGAASASSSGTAEVILGTDAA